MKKVLLLFALVAISAVSINAQEQSWDCRRMRMVVVPIWTLLHCLH